MEQPARRFPSDTTCWRRHWDWVNAGIWDRIHTDILSELQEAGLLDTSERTTDATVVEARQGDDIGPTKCGVGMKLEAAIDANGIPLVVVTAAANGSEIVLGPAALLAIPPGIEVPNGVPVLADKGYDSDPLREQLAGGGSNWSARTGRTG